MAFGGILKKFMLLITAFLLLELQREKEVGAGFFPLPTTLIDSPHIKHQSLVYCGDIFDPTFLVTYSPREYNCGVRGTIMVRLTPKVDVFSLACYLKSYHNNTMLFSEISTDLCSRREDIRCPLLKGETQKFEGGVRMPCVMAKGHYQISAYCTNEDDVTVFCFDWSFTWV